MDKLEYKEKLRMDIKSDIRDLVNGYKIEKDVMGRNRKELYCANGYVIEKLGYKLVDYLDLQEFVKKIGSESENFKTGEKVYGGYSINNRKISFDFTKSYRSLTEGFTALERNDPKKIAPVNLRNLVTLCHELIHAMQYQLAYTHYTFSSDPKICLIYRVIISRKHEIIENGGNLQNFYKFNPLEREAKIRSRRTMIYLLSEIRNDLKTNGINYFDDTADYDGLISSLNEDINSHIFMDYGFDNPLYENAFNKFMEGSTLSNKDFGDITDTYEEIMSLIKGDFIDERELSYFDKIVLGLPVKQIAKVPRPKTSRNRK